MSAPKQFTERENLTGLRNWLRLNMASDAAAVPSQSIVGRLNASINHLSRSAHFDLIELRQLLKDARDEIEKEKS